MSSKVSKISANRPVTKTERPKKAAAKTSKSSKSESIFLQNGSAKTSNRSANTSSEDEVTKARKTILRSKEQLGLTECNTSVAITKDNFAERAQSNLYLLIRCFEGSPANGYGLYLDDKKAKEPGQLSGGYRKVCNKLSECNNALNNVTKNKFSKLPNSIREALLDLVYVRNEGVNFIRNNQELMNAIMNDDYSTIVSNLIYINQKNEGTIRGYYRRSFNRAVLACRDLQGKELKESVIEAENIYKKALDSFNKNGSDSKLLRDEHANFQLAYAEVLGTIQSEQKAKEAARKDSIAKAEIAKNDSIRGVDIDNQQAAVEDKKDGPGFFGRMWNRVKLYAEFMTKPWRDLGNMIGSWFSSDDKEYEFDDNKSVMENMLNDKSVHIDEDEKTGLMQVSIDYKVQKGDYLCVIAEKYGMQDCVIANNNNIEDANLIQEGQTIKMQKLAYKVKKGDRLENIAQDFGVSSIALREINNMDANDNISENQVLEIPGFVYKVKEGDTIEKIADASGITTEKLKEINGLKENKIKTGDILKITYKDGDFSVPESDLKLFAENKNTDSKLNKDKEANEFSNATDLIKHYEGLHLKAYVCPAGKLTIGYGHTKGVKRGDTITEKDAEKYLRQDMKKAEQAVKKHVKVELTQCQYDALVSFVFNLGEGNFRKSTLLKLVNKGEFKKASHQFDRWIYAKGAPCKGLIKRRTSEKELFLQDNNMSTMLADSRVAF